MCHFLDISRTGHVEDVSDEPQVVEVCDETDDGTYIDSARPHPVGVHHFAVCGLTGADALSRCVCAVACRPQQDVAGISVGHGAYNCGPGPTGMIRRSWCW